MICLYIYIYISIHIQYTYRSTRAQGIAARTEDPRPTVAIAFPRPRSPGWHRRERATRAKLRLKVHRERTRFKPRGSLLTYWTSRLASHHTQPSYKELMSRTWNNWGNGGYGKSEGKRSKPHGGEKGGSKDKDRGASLPGYDSVPSAPSTATSMVDTKKDEPLRAAMRELVTKNGLEIPDDLKEYFEPKLNEQINLDQRALNAKRKILQKIDRLKTAKEKKQQNWELFKESMREHVIKERTRFESDQQDIDQALQEAQLSLDKMISGKEDKMDETPVAEESLPEMLDMDTTRKPQEVAASSEDTAKDAQLMEQNELIHQTQMNQMYLAKQLAEMQSQLAQFSSMQNPLRGAH